MESSRDKMAPTASSAVANRSGKPAHQPSYPAAVRRATKFIDAHLGQRIGLLKIAGAAGLSPFHFGRLFKQTTGLSPHRYLLERRISVAKKMLRAQRSSVAEIAAELGFYDQSHFSQVFKRNAGMTPRQFTDQF